MNVMDPWDRVFAMLGHYSIRKGHNDELKELEADYSRSVKKVYADVAKRALIRDDANLPSWVPDWRARHGYIMSEPTTPHCASGLKKPDISINPSAPKVLSIYGIKIDLIEDCSNPLEKGAFHERKSDEENNTRPAVETLWTDICGNTNVFRLSDKYANGEESSLFAYVQTLSNGCMAIYWQNHATERYPDVPIKIWLAHAAAYLTRTVDRAAISPELCHLAKKGDA
ncbi:hypothetical protein MKX08_000178 [Trichoderma sp. CBMAI-0020]|nr:hypothetical protein MKX08_000178 [Trichoderma sp. CBMAI-0020]